jgi:hypothetical protein
MAKFKLDNNYVTLASFLAEFNFTVLKLPAALYEFFIERVYSPSVGSIKYDFIKPQLIGSFQPFADMVNDVVNTFTSYKTAGEFGTDCLQPIFGIGNILKSVFYLAAVALLFVPTLIIAPIFIGLSFKNVSKNMKQLFGLGGTILLSWFLDGIGSAIRGSTQLGATTLLILKAPLRGILALIDYRNANRYEKFDDEDSSDWENVTNEKKVDTKKSPATRFEEDEEDIENLNSKPVLKLAQQNNTTSLTPKFPIDGAKPY